MRLTVVFNLLLTAILQIVTANFDVYQIQEINAVDGSIFQEWAIFADEPDCNEVLNYPVDYWLDRDDVSKRVGVRCESPADCASGKAERIQTLEMAFTNKDPVYHWTIYKNKNFDMYGLDGSISGNCIVFPGDDFQCSRVIATVGGVRKFRCLTAITAQQIIDADKRGLNDLGKPGNATEA